jgi:hypothetical protein
VITIAIINETTVLTDAQLAPVLAALQIQVTRDFYPAWGVDARLVPVMKGSKPPAGAWWVVLMNTSDFAGAAGYHDVTPEGLPLGKAFVKSDIDAGRPWTTTISHEVLEMLADPDISRVVEYAGARKSIFFALEVCDPCQDDKYAYKINEVLVSDFIYPGWFHKFRNYKYFDFNKKISKPFQVLDGGYISVFDPTTGSGWREVDAKSEPPSSFLARARVGSRRERRHLPRAQWQTSAKETQ